MSARASVATRPGKPDARRASTAKPVIAGVTITHPDRVVYPDSGVTKLAVAEYYASVADRLLPYVGDRPLSIVRCPEGAGAECFYQKHPGRYRIPGVDVAMIRERTGRKPYIVASSARALVGLAQANALELHAWGATVESIDRPDTLVIDLDPDRGLAWSAVVAAAREARAVLEGVDIAPLVKTTGGSGVHLVVPLEPRHSWEQVRAFARSVATRLEQRAPERFTATPGEKHRRGKVFVDYLRNSRGATAVVPYSMRARPGATVATPLAWDELSRDAPPSSFTIATVPKRIVRTKDPWADYGKRRQRLPAKAL